MNFIFPLAIFLIPHLIFSGITHEPMIGNQYDRLKPLYPNAHSQHLERLLQEEIKKRIPKQDPYIIQEYPSITWDNIMFHYVNCAIILPYLKMKEPSKAFSLSMNYFRAIFDAINNTKELRPYLYNFPASIRDCHLSVGLGIDPKTETAYPPPFLSAVSVSRLTNPCVQISQHTWNGPGSEPFKFLSFEFSEQDLAEIASLDIPRYNLNKIEISLQQLQATASQEGKKKNTNLSFFYHFAKENNLAFIADAGACAIEQPFDKRIYTGFGYAGQEIYLTLEQAKELVLKTRNEHAVFYKQIGVIDHQVQSCRAEGLESNSNPIDAQKYLAFRLSFWDKYLDRVKAHSIAEVRVYGKRARYYVADELQRLQLLHEEELPAYDVDVPIELQKQSAPK